MIYAFKKPILFNAYRIKTGNDCEHRDPKDWTVMVTDVDPETDIVNEVDKIVSEIDDEEPRGRLTTKTYKIEYPVWVSKITLEVTKTQKGKECQLTEFEILTDQSVMAPLPQRLPWVYKADENGVNFEQIPNEFEKLHHYNLKQGVQVNFVNVSGTIGFDGNKSFMNAADTSLENKHAGRFSGAGKFRVIYTFLKPILFDAYMIRTADDNE